jgi:hypothetical protein
MLSNKWGSKGGKGGKACRSGRRLRKSGSNLKDVEVDITGYNPIAASLSFQEGSRRGAPEGGS